MLSRDCNQLFFNCLSSAKCLVSHFKAGPVATLPPSEAAWSASPLDTSVFKEEEIEEDIVSRVVSGNTVFAQQHADALDSSICFESRKSCLKEVMKCVVAAEHSKDQRLTLQDIHRHKGHTVLGIVQVRWLQASGVIL